MGRATEGLHMNLIIKACTMFNHSKDDVHGARGEDHTTVLDARPMTISMLASFQCREIGLEASPPASER